VNQLYGFLSESLHKYSDDLPWRILNEVFDHLPLCATIDKKVFCVHGGLSPNLNQLNQINAISRFQEIPFEGLVADLLWSDPHDMEGFYRSTRGCGYLWGGDVSQEFCAANGLELIVRAHQLTMQGFEIHHNGLVVTLFSAPNYMRRSGNQAAILVLKSEGEERTKQFIQFNAVSSSNMMEKTEPSSIPAFFL
jgi:diadenosine tetraphosphatase ApaH/serine/threonine PP2A family protein phosphatase